MKKFVLMAMLAMAANFLSPLMPSAHAATTDDVLAQILAQNPNAAQVQQILAIKQELEQGDRRAIVSRVAQTALERTGQGEYAGLVNAFAVGGDMRTAVEATMRQELTTRLAARIAPYGDSLNLIAQLLQNSGLIPQTLIDSNSLTGTAGNYPQIIQ
jgi:hypothetical protein